MWDKKDKGTLARRDLFRAAGLGVGALGAVAAGVTVGTEPAEAADAANAASQGYRETDHVRTVYELSRF
ncbi:formate dehydrogenase [Azospirillum sp. sgz302134]